MTDPSYDPTLVLLKDQVRRLIGDVGENNTWHLLDSEIDFYITLDNDRLFEAAADAADALAAKFSREATSKSVGSMSLARQTAENYRQLAQNLRNKSILMLDASPQAGGLSISGKQVQEQDSDRTQPFFTREQFEIPTTQPPPFGGVE